MSVILTTVLVFLAARQSVLDPDPGTIDEEEDWFNELL
jgi:hypothetical protein